MENEINKFKLKDIHKILIANIILIAIIGLFLFFNKKKSNYIDFIKNYSLMVYLENHKITDQRLEDVSSYWKKYDIFPNRLAGLSSRNDEHIKILEKLPIIRENKHFDERIGAYGLAGSFYNALMHGYNSGKPYFLFMEDDAVPILEPVEFERVFTEAINTLPENNGCYLMGAMVFCKYNQPFTHQWERVNTIKTTVWGCHSVLFTRTSLKKILDHIHKYKINEPIDHLVKKVFGKSLYYWNAHISNSGMCIGLFDQHKTYCGGRTSIIDSMS